MGVAVGVVAGVGEVATTIDRIEERIRSAVPAARVVYLEPDILRDSKNAPSSAADAAASTPPTTSAR